MNPITLFKPIVLRNSLDDMTLSQREIALDLLSNRKFLIPDNNGFLFVKTDKNHKADLPKFYLHGSEAVCYYRQSLNLPDISITIIDIDDIIMDTDDFDTLYDILFFLNNVHMRNMRCIRLRDLGCPEIILWNEYRMLQEYVETLQDNHWCGHPVVNHMDPDDPNKPIGEELERKSLTDIGYSLQDYNHKTVSNVKQILRKEI